MKQEYIEAVRALRTADPSRLLYAWSHFQEEPVLGSLFQFATPDGRAYPPQEQGLPLGDPLMIAGGKYQAWTPALGEKIQKTGLPRCARELSDKQLQKLARLQEHMDETIRDRNWRRHHAHLLRWSWYGDDFLVGGSHESDNEGTDVE